MPHPQHRVANIDERQLEAFEHGEKTRSRQVIFSPVALRPKHGGCGDEQRMRVTVDDVRHGRPEEEGR